MARRSDRCDSPTRDPASACLSASAAPGSRRGRGTYVHIGAGGFRYSRRIDDPARVNRPAAPPPLPATAPRCTVEVLEPAHLVDSSADELLEEIRRKAKSTASSPCWPVPRPSVSWRSCSCSIPRPPSRCAGRRLAAGVLGLAALPWASWSDRRAGLVRIHYVLDPLGDIVREGLERMVDGLRRAHAVWAVHQEHAHGDWKRNAGAGTSVGRRRVGVGFGAPPFIDTNARVGFLSIDGTRLYFFPDRLLILGRGGARAIPYSDLTIRAGSIRFVEEGGVPRDARVLGTTWRYVNKDGGPDRRFRENHQIPVVLYGTLEIAAPSGLRLSLQTSADGLATGTEELLLVIQDAIRQLKSRPAAPPRPGPLPDFDEDPPPLLLQGRQTLGAFAVLLTFRWLTALPEWARLAGWGLLFSLLPVALITWFARGGTPALLLLGAALTLTGAGTGRLAYEHLRRRREARVEEAAARQARFRALLADELKTCPLERFNLTELLATGGISRREAEAVVDETFRRVADLYAQDGIVTDRERSKLRILARALEIDSARADRIEAEAKAVRHKPSVAEIAADETEDEARWLDRLGAQLGMQGSARSPGDVASRPASGGLRVHDPARGAATWGPSRPGWHRDRDRLPSSPPIDPSAPPNPCRRGPPPGRARPRPSIGAPGRDPPTANRERSPWSGAQEVRSPCRSERLRNRARRPGFRQFDPSACPNPHRLGPSPERSSRSPSQVPIGKCRPMWSRSDPPARPNSCRCSPSHGRATPRPADRARACRPSRAGRETSAAQSRPRCGGTARAGWFRSGRSS